MTTLALDVIYRDHGADRGMRSLGQQTDRTAGRFKGLKVVGAAALAAVGVAAVKFGADSVRAYVAAESSQIRLQEAFRKFPKLADINIGSLQKLNTQLALKTRFDDDATASGQAVLAQFKLTGTQITQLTPLLQDYAAKTGKDLPTAARDLGKAMLGQGRSLKAVGINFKDTGSAGGNFSQIMGGLRSQVGGFAEREGKSAAGQAEILKNQFGELQEAAGKQLLPALLKIGSGLLNVVTYVQDSNGVFGSFKRIVSATFGAFSEAVGLGRISFRRFADFVSTHQADITLAIVAGGKVVLAFAAAFATMAEAGLRGAGMLMDGYANLTELLFSSFRGISRAAVLAFGWIPGVGDRIKEADAKFGAFADTTVSGMRRAAAGARGAADGIDTKLRPALAKAGKALDEVGRKEIVKAAARDAVNRASIAIRNLGTASDGSQIRLRKFADVSRLSSNEQRLFRQRLAETRQRMLEQRDAGIRAGDSQAKLTTRWNLGRQALEREFRQMGLSKEEARKLAVRYSQIPKKASTKVEQPGMRQARIDTWDLDKRINNLNNKRVSVTFETNAKKFGLTSTELNAARRGMRAGGPVQNLSGRGRAGADTEPILGEVGEHMLTRADVRAMGGHNQVLDFRRALHMAAGGPVSRSIEASVGHLGPTPNFDRIGDIIARRVGTKIGKSLAPLLGGGGLGPGAVGNPHGYARFHGGLFTKLAAANLRQAERFAGVAFRVMQGGWRPRTSYSGTSHAGDAVDTQNDARVIRAIRRVGWASGDRAGLGNWGAHAHSVPGPGRGYARGSATWQYQDYLRRGGARQGLRSPWGLASGGILTARVAERGPERLLSARQTHSFERMVSAMDRGRGAGNTYYVTLNAPNYVGSRRELRDTVVDMIRLGQLQVARK